MNLRHIDPRSTDWMDAMLEGELERGNVGIGTHNQTKRGGDHQQLSNPDGGHQLDHVEMMAAHAVAALETGQQDSRQPPGR